jgi:methylenetetrahydrofolate dehydrogenase (NADP+)/methenyltetrahydrofolate cyclohydrolase
VLDAGTSEEAGVVKGDADPAVGDKAALFTPTPGGVGPITVAKLFENLLVLDKLKQRNQ